MSIKDRIVKAVLGGVIEREVKKSSRQIVTEIGGSIPGEGYLPPIDFEIFQQTYEQTSWVRAAVGVICKAVTARGYGVVPSKPNPDPKNAEMLAEFFSSCNPNDTLLEILDDVTRDVYVFGNAFLEIVRGADGKPRELWNLDATNMRVQADDHGGIKGYVQVPLFSTIQADRVSFAANEVVHFRLGSRGATLYGLSPLASLVLPISCDRFAMVYNRAFFVNGAKIRGAFIMKNATSEQIERNREYLQARAKSPENAHSDLVLEGDIEFKQIGVNQKDMEFLQLREFTRNEILAVYGVPPSKVSIIETGNIGAGTGEHQTQTFYEETIMPFQMRVAEKITKHIIRQGFGIQDWAFQFNKRSIDEKDQAEIFNIYVQNGVFTPEEVRRLVAPRMPDLQKAIEARKDLAPSETIVDATSAVVALENRFGRAMADIFREIKAAIAAAIAAQLPSLRLRSSDAPKSSVNKASDDLEVILELIDEGKIAKTVARFALEAARKGLKLSAQRHKLKDVDEISLELEERLNGNAANVAGGVSQALKESLRRSLIEGIAASETIPQLMRRIESELDSGATVQVKPVLDADGNVVREGGTRRLSRGTMAETIARSETNRAFNEGNLDALKQGDVEKVQWLLASDACAECLAAAEADAGNKLGKVISVGEASGQIPVHPNCRCTYVVEGL